MADRQLDLFGEVVAGASATTLPDEISEARVPLIPRPIVQAVLDDDSAAIECHGSVAVEPYRFTLTDPQGRWIITAAHEDEVKRGKVTRRMVGRCSCGWVSGFRLHPYGSSGPDLLVAHLRSHQLETHPPAWQVDAERDGWQRVHLLAGRVHCASADCHRLGPALGKRRTDRGQNYRLAAGFGEPCPEHSGSVYDRPYHWEEHDPDEHSGEPGRSHAVGLLDPAGTFWHYWCAPLEGRGLFGFVRDDEVAWTGRTTEDTTSREGTPTDVPSLRPRRKRKEHSMHVSAAEGGRHGTP